MGLLYSYWCNKKTNLFDITNAFENVMTRTYAIILSYFIFITNMCTSITFSACPIHILTILWFCAVKLTARPKSVSLSALPVRLLCGIYTVCAPFTRSCIKDGAGREKTVDSLLCHRVEGFGVCKLEWPINGESLKNLTPLGLTVVAWVGYIYKPSYPLKKKNLVFFFKKKAILKTIKTCLSWIRHIKGSFTF